MIYGLVCVRCRRDIEHLGPGAMWCGNCGWRTVADVEPKKPNPIDTTVHKEKP